MVHNTKEEKVRYIRKRKQYAAPVFGLWLFLLFCCLLAAYFFLNSSFFALYKIEIYGNDVVLRDDIAQLSGLTIGSNLFSINTIDAKLKISMHPNVKEVDIKRKLPNTLNIHILERKPLAMVVMPEEYALVDEEGILLKKVKGTETEGLNFPVISQINVNENKRPGDSIITSGLQAALAIIKQTDDSFLANISEIIAPSEYSLTLKTKNGVKILFGEAVDIGRKLDVIEQFISQNSGVINSQSVEYIDLRYNTSPVIKRKN